MAKHIQSGTDPAAIIAGTKAIAAIIPQIPSGHLNAYLPGALAFFRARRWEDDPETWLRQAQVAADRKAQNPSPQDVSLGGHSYTETIEI